MSYDDRIDPEQLRAHVIRKLAPQLRLQRQRVVLFLHFALFIAVLVVVNSGPQTLPFLYQGTPETFTGPTGFTSTYTDWQMLPFVTALGLLWFGLLVLHAGWVLLNHERERLIRHEMEREYELEKMRLQVDLIRANRSTSDPPSEAKRKRSFHLTDDGELPTAEDINSVDVQQRSEQRHR